MKKLYKIALSVLLVAQSNVMFGMDRQTTFEAFCSFVYGCSSVIDGYRAPCSTPVYSQKSGVGDGFDYYPSHDEVIAYAGSPTKYAERIQKIYFDVDKPTAPCNTPVDYQHNQDSWVGSYPSYDEIRDNFNGPNQGKKAYAKKYEEGQVDDSPTSIVRKASFTDDSVPTRNKDPKEVKGILKKTIIISERSN